MDSDYLANNHNWGTCSGNAIDTQGIGDGIDTQGIEGAIVIQYSTTVLRTEQALVGSTRYSRNRSCDRYSILNRQRRDRNLIVEESLETWSLSNTQQIGDVIDTQQILWEVRAEALIGSTWYSPTILQAEQTMIESLRYSTNQRRDCYLILNKSLIIEDAIDTQRFGHEISIPYAIILKELQAEELVGSTWYSRNCWSLETWLLSDIQYCLTEGQLL